MPLAVFGAADPQQGCNQWQTKKGHRARNQGIGVFQEQDCRQTIYAANFENRMMVQDVDLLTRQSAAQSLQLDQQASPTAGKPTAGKPATGTEPQDEQMTEQPQPRSWN